MPPPFKQEAGIKVLKYKKRRFVLLKKKTLRIIIIVSALIIAAVVILLVASASGRQAEKQQAVNVVASAGVINVGLRGDISELCTYNEDTNQYEGLEKDVIDEIIHRLFPDGILVNYVTVNSETKDAELELGNLDVSLGASINNDVSGIEYTSPYFSEGSALLVMEGQVSSSAELDGKTVAVVQGSRVAQASEDDKDISVLEAYLAEQGINIAVKKYASYPEAVNGLREGFVAAVCASEINLKHFGIKGMLLLTDRFLPSDYCVQVREDLGVFRDAINDVIAEMKKDGTMDALLKKWNLVDYSGLE